MPKGQQSITISERVSRIEKSTFEWSYKYIIWQEEYMRQDNLNILQDTLSILEKGFYEIDGKTIRLKLSRHQMDEVKVFLPEDVKRVCQSKDFKHVHVLGRCCYGCEKADSFTLARKRTEQFSDDLKKKGSKPILVLNLASPVHPGGGVHRGAKAQEEDLCRKSSLLPNLESETASSFCWR